MLALADYETYLANAKPQDESKVTLAPKFNVAKTVVDWAAMDAEQVLRLNRAIGHKV